MAKHKICKRKINAEAINSSQIKQQALTRYN